MADDFDYKGRCEKARKLMETEGVDYLFVSISSDLRYLTGYHTWLSERLTLFVLPRDDRPFMVLPSFEAGRLESLATFFDVKPWTETQDPLDVLCAALKLLQGTTPTIAVSDTMWSVFLLRVMKALPSATYQLASRVLCPLRMIKERMEIACLRKAQSLAMESLSKLSRRLWAGRRERELGQELRGLCEGAGLEVSSIGIVASGPNSAFPHYHVGERIISRGDAVVIDFGGTYLGYHADLTRTFHVGPSSEQFQSAYEIVRDAQERAFQTIGPGRLCEVIDHAGREVIEEAGYGEYFTHRLGHGVGLDEHEEPYIVKGNSLTLRSGMTFSDEPGIYLAGRFGIRIEDLVVVTESGAERLGEMSRELVIVD